MEAIIAINRFTLEPWKTVPSTALCLYDPMFLYGPTFPLRALCPFYGTLSLLWPSAPCTALCLLFSPVSSLQPYISSTTSVPCICTAGAVSIATAHRKRSGIKIEISPLTNMIETSGFFLYTHICSRNVSERRRSDIFNRFLDM